MSYNNYNNNNGYNNNRRSQGKKGKIFLKLKTKKSKDGKEYQIFTGALQRQNGEVLSVKSFGENDNRDMIVLECYEFRPNSGGNNGQM